MRRKSFQTMLEDVQLDEWRRSSSAQQHARVLNQWGALASGVIGARQEAQSVASEKLHHWQAALREQAEPAGATTRLSPGLVVLTQQIDTILKARLAMCTTPESLGRLRRELALICHPDRFAATERGAATDEMKRVNGIIDHAIRKLLPECSGR